MSDKLRMSGLISGLDTESIISALVSSKQVKVDNTKGAQTKLEWKQDLWKDLNKELKSLQSAAQNMRFSTAYAKKTTNVSNPNKASVITNGDAVDSVQSLQIDKLAKTAYLTGGEVATTDGSKATALSKLSDLGFSGEGSFDIKDGKGNVTKSISVTADTTISDVLTQLKEAGLNASFDAENQRFFVSSKTSGKDSDFNLVASDSKGSEALDKLGLQTTGNTEGVNYATKINGSDAEITLNGAKFKSSTNVFNINGLTITAMGTTDKNEEITLTTTLDTSGIYDSIKNFIKTYNSVINKLDKYYNADNTTKKNPLTDEEKDALSDTEAEKYTDNLKEGLLSGDSNLNSIISSLSSAMSQGVEVNGKTMYLSYFGIGTLEYFSAAEDEKHALHIDGDPDDENTAGNNDVLKAMISKDPDTIVSFFSQLSNNLYQNMNSLSSSVKDYRSFGSFYDDKKMKTDYTDYTSKIADLEEKLNAYEDKLYKQYSAMEKSLAKLQSNSSSLTGLFGS